MVSTRSSVSVTMNADDAHANDANATNNANANADDADDADTKDADTANKADNNANTNKDNNLSDEVDPFPVLSCKEHSRFIEIQRIIIQTFICEFWLERAVHYTTFNPPFGIVYEGTLVDILELDLIIYKIIFARERRSSTSPSLELSQRNLHTCSRALMGYTGRTEQRQRQQQGRQ